MTPNQLKIWLVIFWLGLFNLSAATAANQLGNWSGYGTLTPQGKLQYKSFFINEHIYRYALEDLRDIRITDSKGEFVPYLIQSGFQANKQSRLIYESRLIKSFRTKDNLTFDFNIVSQSSNTDVRGNVLRLELPLRDFYKEVEVLGSFDGIHWDSLGRKSLFRIDNLIKSDIVFDKTETYPFYRLTVYHNSENIEIKGLQLVFENNETVWSKFQRTVKLSYQITNKAGLTRIHIKNLQHLKIKQIDLNIIENFKREYRVYLDREKDIVPVGDGMIYNLQFQNHHVSDTKIDLAGGFDSSSELVIEIKNFDDPPLKINNIQIEYFVDRIIFRERGSHIYHVHFGNPNARKPVYDIENYRSEIENEKTDQLTINDIKVKKLENRVTKEPLNYQLIFNIVVGAVTILLVVLLVRKLNNT